MGTNQAEKEIAAGSMAPERHPHLHDVDPEAQRRVRRKIDMVVLPMVWKVLSANIQI